LEPSLAFAEKFQNVYVGYVQVADQARTTYAQRTLYYDLMVQVRQELKKAPRVIVDSPLQLATWYMDRDGKAVADLGKTHFIIAIPRIEHDATAGDVLRISWEVGAIGSIEEQQVPIFGGDLTESIEATIIKDGSEAAIQASTPRNKAAVVAEQ